MIGNLYYISGKDVFVLQPNIEKDEVVEYIVEDRRFFGAPDKYCIKEYSQFTEYIFTYKETISTSYYFSTLPYKVAIELIANRCKECAPK